MLSVWVCDRHVTTQHGDGDGWKEDDAVEIVIIVSHRLAVSRQCVNYQLQPSARAHGVVALVVVSLFTVHRKVATGPKSGSGHCGSRKETPQAPFNDDL